MKKLVRKFWSSRQGIAAVEAALILPILLVIYVGALVVYDSYKGYRLVSHTSNTLADLTSRYGELGDDELGFLFATGTALLDKYAVEDDFYIVVSSIENVPNDGLRVAWSGATGNGTGLDDDDISSLQLPEIPEGESVIIVSTLVEFTPLFSPDSIVIDKTAVRNPRFVSTIDFM